MCRWLAYMGPPLEIAALVLRPKQSLIRQSRSANLGVTPVNGDGFGLAWWDNNPEPGLFKDTQPAWNDENLKSLASQISVAAVHGACSGLHGHGDQSLQLSSVFVR